MQTDVECVRQSWKAVTSKLATLAVGKHHEPQGDVQVKSSMSLVGVLHTAELSLVRVLITQFTMSLEVEHVPSCCCAA